MNKTIRVNPLRASSIEKAIRQLEEYRKALEEFPKKYTEAMIEELKTIIAEEAPNSAIGMMKSVYVNNLGDKAEGVIVFDGHVEFIEFGTGIVGLNLHEGINDEWLNALPPPYNIYWNTGTFIVHDKKSPDDLDYWKYRNSEGKWVTTNGIPANPFLYRSVERLIGMHIRLRNEVLGGIR